MNNKFIIFFFPNLVNYTTSLISRQIVLLFSDRFAEHICQFSFFQKNILKFSKYLLYCQWKFQKSLELGLLMLIYVNLFRHLVSNSDT